MTLLFGSANKAVVLVYIISEQSLTYCRLQMDNKEQRNPSRMQRVFDDIGLCRMKRLDIYGLRGGRKQFFCYFIHEMILLDLDGPLKLPIRKALTRSLNNSM